MEDDRPAAKGAPAFRAINGDREALERRLMWAILFDYPDKDSSQTPPDTRRELDASRR